LCTYVTNISSHTSSCSSSDGSNISGHILPGEIELEPTTTTTTAGYTRSISDQFGYFEHSEANILGLLHHLGLHEELSEEPGTTTINRSTLLPSSFVLQEFEQMLPREILDFLIRFFIKEFNWINQFLHPPSFLAKYEKWWNESGNITSIQHVEFAVLILRICAHASQFLPSSTYTVDTIRGMSLSDVRDQCNKVGDRLAMICLNASPRGSVSRVLHLCFLALRHECDGNMTASWSSLCDAIKAAQLAGLHQLPARSASIDTNELEGEMRRRTLCNLYIWDSRLARSLDRVPFLNPGFYRIECPKMRSGAEETAEQSGAPEPFMERLTQARLVRYWEELYTETSDPLSAYDPAIAEERYEKFNTQFMPSIPDALALSPDTRWDDRLPLLRHQRLLFSIALFESISHNFRPLLFLDPGKIQSLPCYKRALLCSHRQILVRSALGILDSVSMLHNLLGKSHTRLSLIPFLTFEACVILGSLLLVDIRDGRGDEHEFTADAGPRQPSFPHPYCKDPLLAIITDISVGRCVQALNDALLRMKILAEGSVLAEVGANYLTRLVENVHASLFPSSPDKALSPQSFQDRGVQIEQKQSYKIANGSPSLSSILDYFPQTTVMDDSWSSLGWDMELGSSDNLWEDMAFSMDMDIKFLAHPH
ncbi:hypothetical protein N7536_006552, partial [Penicillium majusculum]